jgi:hypothetical protein
VDWDDADPAALFAAIREQAPPADAERMVWAFERVLAAARVDPVLLDHVAVAAICALAYRDGETPREVLEHLSRRSVSDCRWDEAFAGLL